MVSYMGFTEVFIVKKTGLKITALTAVACLTLSGCKASYFGLPGLFYEAVEATEDILEESLYYEGDLGEENVDIWTWPDSDEHEDSFDWDDYEYENIIHIDDCQYVINPLFHTIKRAATSLR